MQMKALTQLYMRLPPIAQDALVSLEGLRLKRQRYNRTFFRLLEEGRQRSSWTTAAIELYRDQRLHAFVQHAASSVPYYQRLFEELKLDPRAIQTLDDLQALPVLHKHQVRENPHDFFSHAIPARQSHRRITSGTTGAGLWFLETRLAEHEQWATWWRGWERHGIPFGVRRATFSGRALVPIERRAPPFWRYNHADQQLLFSAYHLDPQSAVCYLEELRRYRPAWLHGYPSILSQLGRKLLEARQPLGYRVEWISTSSEVLLPAQKEIIGEAFGVTPIEHYGLAEAAASFSECRSGALHVDEDFAAVEFVPDSRGHGFHLLGSNFSNPATPLLRYDTGDLVELGAATCSCGVPGRVVEQIAGRQNDFILTSRGRRLIGLHRIFRHAPGIRQSQLYQRLPGEVIVRIVRGEDFVAENEGAIAGEFRRWAGDDLRLQFEYREGLPSEPNGKVRFVISDVAGGGPDQPAGQE